MVHQPIRSRWMKPTNVGLSRIGTERRPEEVAQSRYGGGGNVVPPEVKFVRVRIPSRTRPPLYFPPASTRRACGRSGWQCAFGVGDAFIERSSSFPFPDDERR